VQAQETEVGNDRISGLAGLGKRSPVLASGLTVAMLGLAGIPGTIGFIGKFRLIQALVDGGYGWLAIILVVGAMISLGYYLKVVAAVWMSPSVAAAGNNGTPVAGVPGSGPAFAPIAGGSPEADKLPYPEVVLVGAVFGAMTIVFGVIPGPIFHLAAHAGAALTGLI
jgi:NADH-quinone oxidoreductase subunit N